MRYFILCLVLFGRADFRSVTAAPTITRQPAAVTATKGVASTFSVAATGVDPITYQWSFRGAAIAEGTSNVLRIAAASIDNLGNYSVSVTDSTGTVESKTVTLSLNAVVQPNFSPGLVVALSNSLLTFRWTGEGILQTAPAPSGPWVNSGAVRKNFSTNAAPAIPTFYRLRNPHPRTPKVFIPSSYRSESAMPLLIFLHGYGGTGDGYESYMRLQPQAEALGFLYCHPDGVVDPRGAEAWNGWEVCCDFDKKEVNDIGFLRELMGRIATDYHVDLKRVHFAGHSNGGFMSFRMAMEYPELIASIAAISGTIDQVSTLPPPSGPVNILQIHGTSDEVVSYNGGTVSGGIPITGSFTSTHEVLRRWAEWNGCTDLVEETQPSLDLVTAVGNDTLVSRYNSAPAGGAIEHWAIRNALHSPTWNATFPKQLAEWLLAHPKP